MTDTHEIEPAVKGLIAKTLAEANVLLAEVQSHVSDHDLHSTLDTILTNTVQLSEIRHSHEAEVRKILVSVQPQVRDILSVILEAAETSCLRHRRDLDQLAHLISDLLGSLTEKPVRTRPAVSKMEMRFAAKRL